ncbi:hypothetical protein [Kribbella sindirgiensis]|uniref:Uncharacterized protein n=1 Tax=Kribbella sindirgiensis TaxID=1124744 RepID=A0A4R0IBP4_9ACTN|nr:hypothetical protein [Kribbella sindirgiensis]TCC19942.1 hypothetical protein E0H50_37565 [Kribbella sindirgiensis]
MEHTEIVYTLVLHSDGELSARAFRTEQARDEALITEAVERFEVSTKAGTVDDEWSLERVRQEPAEFISDDSYGYTDVSKDAVVLEGETA